MGWFSKVASSITGGDVISGIGSIVQGGASYLASREQAKAAEDAQDRAEGIYNRTYADLAPQRRLGNEAIKSLGDIYLRGTKDFTAAPGYDFRVNEGLKARERIAAARGNQLSGAQIKEATRYGQDYGTREYDNEFARLSALAGYGPAASSQAQQAGNNFVINAGTAGQNAGAARASGYEGVGSAVNTGLNNAVTLRALRGYY